MLSLLHLSRCPRVLTNESLNETSNYAESDIRLAAGRVPSGGIMYEFLKEAAICLRFDTHIPGSAKVLLWPARRRRPGTHDDGG